MGIPRGPAISGGSPEIYASIGAELNGGIGTS